MTVVGLRGSQSNEEAIYEQVLGMANDIKNISNPALCQLIWAKKEGSYDFFVGFAVSAVEDLPKGFEVQEVAASKYAVFEHEGDGSLLESFSWAIHGKWLPNSGYTYDESDVSQIFFATEGDNLKEGAYHWEVFVPIG